MRYLGALVCAGMLSACHSHIRHYSPPPRVAFHHHRLSCGHVVDCRYRGSAHDFEPHHDHDRYWHLHRTRDGRLFRCYVERNTHRR